MRFGPRGVSAAGWPFPNTRPTLAPSATACGKSRTLTPPEPPELHEHLLAALACERDRLDIAGAADQATTVDAMYAIARRLPRLFQLPHPTAPGLCLVGARVDPAAFIADWTGAGASATGKGMEPLDAVLGCLGEAAEYLSQQTWGDEALVVASRPPRSSLDDGSVAQLLDLAGHPAAPPPLAWARTRRLHDDAETWLPAALCYRRPAAPVPRIKLGSGCAVGATVAAAELHAMLELIERDAVALWWIGGRRPRRVSDRTARAAGVAALMDRLRGGRTDRRQWLLDISTDLAVPAIVSVSCAADGSGLACGFAARLDTADAIRAAVLEMCQMEIVIHLVHLKRAQQGDAALDTTDLAHLRRCHGFDVAGCPVLQEEHAAPPAEPVGPTLAGPTLAGPELAGHLAGHGIHVHGLDLTRKALGIPAFRALSCQLQPMPGTAVLPRLAQEVERSGGGPGLGEAGTVGIEIL